MSTNFSMRKSENQVDSVNPLSHRIVDVDCAYESGKFIVKSLPSVVPGLFTIRFTAPADYAAGNAIVVKGKDLPVRTPGMAAAASDTFMAGAVVHCDIDLDRELAFFWQGGAGCASGNYGRKPLTSNTTYYLRKDGSDDNNGLSEGGAFQTWDRMRRELMCIDGAGYTLTINLGAGAWQDSFVFDGQQCLGFAYIQLEGQGGSTIISPEGPSGVYSAHGCTVFVRDISIIGAKNALHSFKSGDLTVNGAVTIASSVTQQTPVLANLNGFIHLTEDAEVTFKDNASIVSLLRTFYGGLILVKAGARIVLSGTNSGSHFAHADWNSQINFKAGATFSGTFTGKKYAVSHGGVLYHGSAILPGTQAGTSVSPGIAW